MDWKLILKAFLVLLLISFLLTIEARADVTSSGSTDNTQTNQSGGNTAITGGYESSTTYQSGSESTTTTNNDTTNSTNTKTAVNSSSAPAMSVYGQDSCVIPLAAGITVIGFSGTFGSYYVDPDCSRRKMAKLLSQVMGMKVAGITLLCQDENVWKAMMNAGTPCPIDGLIGEKAKARWIEKRKGNLSSQTTKQSMTWNKDEDFNPSN